MKKYFLYLLVVLLFLSAGCSGVFGKHSRNTKKANSAVASRKKSKGKSNQKKSRPAHKKLKYKKGGVIYIVK